MENGNVQNCQTTPKRSLIEDTRPIVRAGYSLGGGGIPVYVLYCNVLTGIRPIPVIWSSAGKRQLSC